MKASQTTVPLPKTIGQEYLVRVNRKGTVTLPKPVRKLLKAEKKGQVVVRVEEDKITLQELPMSLEEAKGSVPPLDPPKSLKEIRKAVREERVERYLKKNT